ncbi:putative nicotinamide N-methyase [Azospirillum agricola]|nr:putative nicotinamide N-methyase [Azospirillum agricola]
MPWWSDLITRVSLRDAMDWWAVLWTVGGALIAGHRLDRHILRQRGVPPWYRTDMGAWAGLAVGVLISILS